MMDLLTSAMDAGAALAETFSKPVNTGASFTRYGTVVKNNGTTLDVELCGATLAAVPMLTTCAGAKAGDRCLLTVDGPLVTVTGILANAGNAHYVNKDGWYITHLAGLTIATTTLVGTATNFTTTGTSTNLYKNLGTTNYPVTFKEIPVTVVCPDGTVLKADTVGNSTTKFETRIMFDGTTGWMGSRVPYRVSVITIGIV